MRFDLDDFRVSRGKDFRIAKWPTKTRPLYRSEDEYRESLATDVKALSDLQRRLYASNRYSLLLVFQAVDTAGKDGAISHVLSGVNPQGCEVHSFRHPSAEELDHDFLWRTTCRLPARGRIGVFNRSYYEEVLITRVHPEILRAEAVADEQAGTKMYWKRRYRSILDLESHLHRNGTRIVKFFLHLSKEEQRKRLLERIDEPDKNWKAQAGDLVERKFWNQYMAAYEACIRATSTKAAPWHVVPADDKLNARLIVMRIVVDALRGLDLAFPPMTRARRAELQAMRRQLTRRGG